MTQSHPSDRAIDTLVAGEPSPDIAAHVAECLSCQHRVAIRERERERLLARLPPARFVAGVAARRAGLRTRRRRQASIGFAAGLAALAASWMLVPCGRPMDDPDVRLKGASVNVFRKRGDRVTELGARDQVRAGDGLRVTIVADRPARATVWFVDADGRVDPYPGSDAVALVAGENVLPGSVTVDAPCADLRLVVRIAGTELERALTCE